MTRHPRALCAHCEKRVHLTPLGRFWTHDRGEDSCPGSLTLVTDPPPIAPPVPEVVEVVDSDPTPDPTFVAEDASVYTSRVAHGAASEMLACAHLLRQGWHVFRAVAATCPVDLMVMRGGEVLRVEVKSLSQGCHFSWPRNDEWDVLLVVDAEDVHEIPAGTAYRDAINAVRAHYGLGPVPIRSKRVWGMESTLRSERAS